MTPEFDVVGGAPDKDELAALMAVGAAVQEVSLLLEAAEAPPAAVPGTVPVCSEWTSRGRGAAVRGAGVRIPGTFSNDWRYSLRG